MLTGPMTCWSSSMKGVVAAPALVKTSSALSSSVLAAAFEAVSTDSEMTYYPDENECYPALEWRHDQSIRKWQQNDPYFDRPIFYSVRTVEFDPTTGSRKRLAFYPSPDAAYVLRVPMILRPCSLSLRRRFSFSGLMAR